jgi:hypothetical protein
MTEESGGDKKHNVVKCHFGEKLFTKKEYFDIFSKEITRYT